MGPPMSSLTFWTIQGMCSPALSACFAPCSAAASAAPGSLSNQNNISSFLSIDDCEIDLDESFDHRRDHERAEADERADDDSECNRHAHQAEKTPLHRCRIGSTKRTATCIVHNFIHDRSRRF